MEHLDWDTIILTIGLLISLFFNWKQYHREKNRDKISEEERQKADEKRLNIKIKQNGNSYSLSENIKIYHISYSITNKCQKLIHTDKFFLKIIDKKENHIHQLKLKSVKRNNTVKPNDPPLNSMIAFCRDHTFEKLFSSQEEYRMILIVKDDDGESFYSNSLTPNLTQPTP